jgi:hypothetical protein
MENNWTKDDLKIYILIYCSNADFSESKLEKKYIKSKVESSDFDKIHQEFDNDKDYQSIQKIQASIAEHNFHNTDLLINEIMELFLIDHEMDILEENLLRGLKHILK